MSGKEAVAGTLLHKLSASPTFVNLLHQVCEQGSGRAAPNQSLYQVLRCLKGKSGLKHALYFRYDSFVVTALLPVMVCAGSPVALRVGLESAYTNRLKDTGLMRYESYGLGAMITLAIPFRSGRTLI
jgi:hypothetical protein